MTALTNKEVAEQNEQPAAPSRTSQGRPSLGARAEAPGNPTSQEPGLPWDVTEVAPGPILLECLDTLLATIEWNNADLIAFEQKHPDYRPRMFLRLLTYAYATGVFSSEDVVEGCYQNDVLRSICEGDPPAPRAIVAFRRENRGLLQWLLVEVFKQAIKHNLQLGDFLILPGLKKYLADAASARIDIARHMDRGAREE